MMDNNTSGSSMFLSMQILEDGDLRVVSGSQFEDHIPESERAYYKDILHGLNIILSLSVDLVVHTGTMARVVSTYDFETDDEDAPEEDVTEAQQESNVLRFKDRLN